MPLLSLASALVTTDSLLGLDGVREQARVGVSKEAVHQRQGLVLPQLDVAWWRVVSLTSQRQDCR